MRILTWNLRFDCQPDDISVAQSLKELPDPMVSPHFMRKHGEQPWSARRIAVAREILYEEPSLIGFQEALRRQVDDLQELLGDNWSWVGVGRDDGKDRGEYNPIFFNKSRTMLLDTETFWLSNTPFSPSRYPGAGSLRIANVTRFALADSPQTSFALINTHLDDWSEGQRKLGASLLLARARFEAVVKKCAVFITGDFNSEQSGHDSRAYRILTGAEAPVPLPEDFNSKFGVPDGECPDFTMIDLRGATPRLAVSGFFRTFTGFQNSLGEGRYGRIDYILGGSNRGWESQRYKTANIVTDDGLLSSDHRPVYADVSIRSLA